MIIDTATVASETALSEALTPLITGLMPILILIIIGNIIIQLKKSNKNSQKAYKNNSNSQANSFNSQYNKRAYMLKDSILTNAETTFYKQLIRYVNPDHIVCPKVSVKDFICVDRGKVGNNYMNFFGKIAQKHVDFLICDRATLNPIYAIELDDSSHRNIKAQQSDNFKNELYNSVGLELVRIRVKSSYNHMDFATLPYSYTANNSRY